MLTLALVTVVALAIPVISFLVGKVPTRWGGIESRADDPAMFWAYFAFWALVAGACVVALVGRITGLID